VNSRILLTAVVGTALALRLWGLTYGLPYDLTADEPHQIVQALKIGAGEGGPLVRMWHTIGKGGLDYLLFFEYSALYAFWWLAGRVQGPTDFALQYLTNPTAFYVVGRVTVAVLGALSTLAVFYVGRRMYDERIGLAAAFVGAVAYYPTSVSHVINVHVPMTSALWAGIATYLLYETSGRRRHLVTAGLLCGAAIALAYSAAVGLLMLLVALLFVPVRANDRTHRLTDAVILGGGAIVSVALMSPDLLTGAGLLFQNFVATSASAPTAADTRSAIDSVTILQPHDWFGVAQLLFTPDNLLTTTAAVIGMIAGVVSRERWTILLSAATVFFILLISASNRGLQEAYLLPVIPAVWLLAGRGVAAVSRRRAPVMIAGVAAIAAASLFFTVREDLMLMTPDTRVLAKQWIESHVPPGSKILMDGMRFRFVQSPPLNAGKATIERRLADLESSELALSTMMLSLYREAGERTEGPTYDLYSTVYGLEVEDLDYYVHSCFAYVVVSSSNEKRYLTDAASRQHPKSARFYRDIKIDPRFQLVYTAAPVMWQQVGPTISIYKIRCEPVAVPATKAS
jgi:hypothetical protein